MCMSFINKINVNFNDMFSFSDQSIHWKQLNIRIFKGKYFVFGFLISTLQGCFCLAFLIKHVFFFYKKVEEIVNYTYRIVEVTYDIDGYTTLQLPVMNQISWTIYSVARYNQYLTTTTIVSTLDKEGSSIFRNLKYEIRNK